MSRSRIRSRMPSVTSGISMLGGLGQRPFRVPNRLGTALLCRSEEFRILEDLLQLRRRISVSGLAHVPALVAGNLDQQSVADHRTRGQLRDVLGAGPFVSVFRSEERRVGKE